MKNWFLLFASLIGLYGVDLHCSQQAQIEIEVGPEDDDYDDDYYYDEDGPQIWIGPGLYYGFWFENEYDYHNWCRNNYHNYRHNHDHNHDHEHNHGDHGHGGGERREGRGGSGHGGGGHGGGGHGGGGGHR